MINKKKILVVCSRNKRRSLTAEYMYKNDQRLEIRSVGTSPVARIKIKESDVRWADVILCMESKQKEIVVDSFGKNNVSLNIVVLDIEDKYEFMDTELVEILKNEIEEFLN